MSPTMSPTMSPRSSSRNSSKPSSRSLSRTPRMTTIEQSPSEFLEEDCVEEDCVEEDCVEDDVNSLMSLNELPLPKITEKIDRSCLKVLYPCFKEIGLIRPNISEKQFCSMNLATLHLDCVKFGIIPSIEKMLFPILKGSVNKSSPNDKVFEQVPIGKDNGYYFDLEKVEREQITIFICRERYEEIYIQKGSYDLYTVELQNQYKKSKNSKYKRPIYYEHRIMNRRISWHQLVALIDIPEVRSPNCGGLMFDSGLKRWYWSRGDSNDVIKNSHKRHSMKHSMRHSMEHSMRPSQETSMKHYMKPSYRGFHGMSRGMSYDEYDD